MDDDLTVAPTSWLCRNEAERLRWLDMHERLKPASVRSLLVLGLFLAPALPDMNPLSLVPLNLAVVLFFAMQRAATRSVRPEIRVALALAGAQALLTAAIVINGHQHVGSLVLLLWPLVGTVAGMASRAVVAGTVYTGLLMVVAALGFDGALVRAEPIRLLAPLGMLFAIAILLSALQASDVEHRSAAIVDPLTGMFNRAALATRTVELGHQSVLTGQPVGLILGDVDHFKQINDDHGHATGDAVLGAIAHRLRKHVRDVDLAYRLGGEEFAVLVMGADEAHVGTLAERLRAEIAASPVGGVAITMSFGVAASPAGEPFEWPPVFERADRALYAAKSAGRDRVHSGALAAATPTPA